jgi:hypothetical protein
MGPEKSLLLRDAAVLHFFLSRDPFSASHALLLMKGGKTAGVNQPPRACAKNRRTALI